MEGIFVKFPNLCVLRIVLKPDPVIDPVTGSDGLARVNLEKKNAYIKRLTNYKFTMQHLYKPNLNFKPTT
jgi:hypothetical protein